MSADPSHDPTDLRGRIARRTARVGVIGLGYVGLPLSRVFAARGFPVTGFDIDPGKVAHLNAGKSYLAHVPDEAVRSMLGQGRFEASADFARLGEVDIVLICVPTPHTPVIRTRFEGQSLSDIPCPFRDRRGIEGPLLPPAPGLL